MRLFFTLLALAVLGFWLWKEIQHGQELEAQLDDAKKQLEVYQQQFQAQNQSGARPPGSWMWGKDASNPLNYPATRFGQPKQAITH